MRLLNTTTLQLRYFLGDIPRYAILSHTWEDEEVTFDDMKPGGAAQSLKGYHKLQSAANLARREGYQYIWIDTCCIDKSSSAELSEAINSMFAWYARAAICYAFLSDYSHGFDYIPSRSGLKTTWTSSLGQCKWFSRGWTLQELIAPKYVQFFDRNWTDAGSRESNASDIHLATGIQKNILTRDAFLSEISAAVKMSWAAKRVTTRPEDMAYCLLGLFKVNMPLLYGEGAAKAFERLQQEFLKENEDYSIFAWWAPAEEASVRHWSLLAPAPSYFSESGSIGSCVRSYGGSQPAEVTSRGIRVEMPLARVKGDRTASLYFTFLYEQENGSPTVFLILQRLSPFEPLFTRVVPYVRPTLSDLDTIQVPSASLSHEFLGSFASPSTMGFDHLESVTMASKQDFQSQLIFVRAKPAPRAPTRFHGLDDIECKKDIGGHIIWDFYDKREEALQVRGFDGRIVVGLRHVHLRFLADTRDVRVKRQWNERICMVLGFESEAHTPFGTESPWRRPFVGFTSRLYESPIDIQNDGRNHDLLRADTWRLEGDLVLTAQLKPGFYKGLASHQVSLTISKADDIDEGSGASPRPEVWTVNHLQF